MKNISLGRRPPRTTPQSTPSPGTQKRRGGRSRHGGRVSLRHLRSGVTLLELLVAVTVSAIVITLSLTVFSNMSRGFMIQKNRAEAAGDMIAAKKRIDGCLAGIVSINTCSDKALSCRKADEDSLVEIRFAKDSLRFGNKAICGNLKDFTFVLVTKTAGPWALLWNARQKDGAWFGGAVYGRR